MDEIPASYIYHLTPLELWETQRSHQWFAPPDLGVVGYIHCSDSTDMLLKVANRFYIGCDGDFTVLKIDQNLLQSPVRYESPEEVHLPGMKPARPEGDVGEPSSGHSSIRRSITKDQLRECTGLEQGEGRQLLFPHVYGPINVGAIVDDRLCHREPDTGRFLQIKGDPAKAEADVQDEIRKSVEQDPVVLFMKGLPGAPQCGFSYRAVQILNAHDIEFRAYNVLSNDALREGVKKFSAWPTIPQLYVRGNFVGGCDIMVEMLVNGELKRMFEKEGLMKKVKKQ